MPSKHGHIIQGNEQLLSEMTMVYKTIKGHYHLIWTDYVSSTLLYECYRVEADQRCSPGADHITMLSRTHNMSQTVYDMMVEKATEMCFVPIKIDPVTNIDRHGLGK